MGPVALPQISLTSASALESPTALKIHGLKASNTNDMSKLVKVTDGLYKTYWVARGIGVWIQADVGDSGATISQMDISWRNGDRRMYNFVLLLSVDGKVYEEVYRGTSSGKTISYEKYDFPDKQARYVKIVVNGNNSDKYAKISDIRVMGIPGQQTPPPPPPDDDNTAGDSNEMGVWFYSGDFAQVQNSMVDKLLQRNVNTIYFSAANDGNGWDNPTLSSQYTNFINYAKSKGMKVFGVTLEDPTYVLMTESELNAAFGGFISKTKGKFDTYVIDVEPHSINVKYPGQYPEYKDNVKYYLEKYVQMSKTLRKIADSHGVQYIDTIPPNYHTKMINVGIAGGINQLSSHSVNLMAYENTIEKVMDSTAAIRADSTKRIVINIKVTPGLGDPTLEGQEIPRAIKTLRQHSLPIGLWYATDVMKLDASLFPPP